ncbi:beta-galactosidase [Saccharibacillus sp. CPCC 101409]|uniref:beta-galactosidase n=1 Tax=Saccharibacillus sp. CPCC 101409 TaxID=3058041 RepID=UPI0026739049|nr:beta-galactosidase [Saccharibacillus sp. CPCC 101409]MDO3411951.1 beta-galactosidase [Saccharibacillus sp. CPCC 101409]
MNILVFYDADFPYAGARPSADALNALTGRAELADASNLEQRLRERKWDALVQLHGSYFPKNAWSAVRTHLSAGGGLVNAGGAPYREPVSEDAAQSGLRIERPQVAYHQNLNIHDALQVDSSSVRFFKASDEFPLLKGKESLFGAAPTWGLTLHPSKKSDIPEEMGSSGPMDLFIYPLLTGVDEDGRERSAPVVLLESYKGEYAGGRWILVNQQLDENFWRRGGAELLLELADYTARGAAEIWLKNTFAAYEPGEQPSVTLQLQSLGRTSAPEANWNFRFEVQREGGASALWSGEAQLAAGPASPDLRFVRLPIPLRVEPGLYRIVCEAASDAGERRVLTQAFWGMDRELLTSGEPLTAGRDYFRRGGKPVPIVGMTYMTSDVARKFLHLPNVERWDRDMAEMKRAGINLIRTGVWTGYRMMMFADGHAAEDALRAIDAFVLTASRHDLEVTFTFFSFAPEAWEGDNPYLDPRSVEAQKRFIASIVSRHRGSTRVHWDLINEPSLFHPRRVFEGPVTAGDDFERRAWSEWLRDRFGGDIRRLQERWNMTPEQLPSFESAQAPDPDDKYFRSVVQPKKWLRWLDYTLFSTAMHNRWASELIGTIRRGDPKQMVTVGQDEGIASQRPSPFFYAEAVDYTTVHSWWQMDSLAWDGIFTKTPHKPNLIQETGIMHVQHPDGRAKRTEEELRDILERKYAYAFSTGGAGAVQWIWNTNYFMNNANESNIGALRADGTQKPEADVSYDFGRFMTEAAGLFEDRKPEDVAIVYPFSNDFSNRNLAFEATTRAARVLTLGMNVHPRGIGEYHLGELSDAERGAASGPPRLVIVPSAHNFDDQAFEHLLELARAGSTVLWTGPLRLDAHWGPARERLTEEFGDLANGNVLREETLKIGEDKYHAGFNERKIDTLEIERPAGNFGEVELLEAPLGGGRFIYCPLPVELNERREPIRALYDYALRRAEVEAPLDWLEGGDLPGVYGRKLEFREGSLYIFVSEYGADTDISFRDVSTGKAYGFKLPRGRIAMFTVDKDGALRTVYRPEDGGVRIIG